MQAVLAPGSTLARGLLESGMGVVFFVVLLKLFLRLVDPGSEGDLPRTALEPQLFDLHVPGPRRPSEYIRNARTFLLPKLQHRSPPPPPHNPSDPPPLHHAPLPKQPRQVAPHLAVSSVRSSPKRQVQARKPPPANRNCLVVLVLCGDVRGWRGCGLVVRSRSEIWGYGRWLLR